LRFYRDGGGVRAEFTPTTTHQGYVRITHGGIVSTLLDEAMSWAVIDSGRLAVTARMEVQFRRPVPVGMPLVVSGRVVRDRGRLVEAAGDVRDGDGAVLAQSTGVFARVNEDQQRDWEAVYLGEGGEH
jgi:uncharacterized protein (TIGR00369 family)